MNESLDVLFAGFPRRQEIPLKKAYEQLEAMASTSAPGAVDATSFTGTDEGDRIQNALDSLSNGGVVDCRGFGSTGVISSEIVVPSNCTLLFGDTTFTVNAPKIFECNNDYISIIGAGVGRTVFVYGNDQAANATNAIRTGSGTTVLNTIHFEGFTVDGNKANQTGISGDLTQTVELRNVKNGTMRNIESLRAVGSGLAVSSTGADIDNVLVEGCIVEDFADRADGDFPGIQVRFGSTSGAETRNLRIVGNRIDGSANGGSGIKCNSQGGYNGTSQGITISENYIVVGDGGASSTLGIELNGGTETGTLERFSINDNTVLGENNTNTDIFGISLGGNGANVLHGSVVGNDVKECRLFGCESAGASQVIWSANTVQACGPCTIDNQTATTMEDVVIDGNIYQDPVGIAVQFLGGASSTNRHFVFSNNLIKNVLNGNDAIEFNMNDAGTFGSLHVVGNTIVGDGVSTARMAIFLQGWDDAVISNNVFVDWNGGGNGTLNLHSTTSGVSGDGNRFVNCNTYVTDNGAGNAVRVNSGNEVATGTVTIDPSRSAVEIDSSGGAVTATLGSGQYLGQILMIVMTDASNSSTLSVTNHSTSDPEVFTFDAVDETLVLCWAGTEWITIASEGVTT